MKNTLHTALQLLATAWIAFLAVKLLIYSQSGKHQDHWHVPNGTAILLNLNVKLLY